MTAAILGIALFLLPLGDAARAPRKETNPVVISGIVGGCLCPGWWTVDITADGRLSVKVVGEALVARRLSTQERARVAELLTALPTNRSHYGFGVYYVDASVGYRLKVRDGDRWREYSISSDLRVEESTDQDVKAVGDIWRYLRTLFRSATALDVMTGVRP
jgi:hypothetical protein